MNFYEKNKTIVNKIKGINVEFLDITVLLDNVSLGEDWYKQNNALLNVIKNNNIGSNLLYGYNNINIDLDIDFLINQLVVDFSPEIINFVIYFDKFEDIIFSKKDLSNNQLLTSIIDIDISKINDVNIIVNLKKSLNFILSSTSNKRIHSIIEPLFIRAGFKEDQLLNSLDNISSFFESSDFSFRNDTHFEFRLIYFISEISKKMSLTSDKKKFLEEFKNIYLNNGTISKEFQNMLDFNKINLSNEEKFEIFMLIFFGNKKKLFINEESLQFFKKSFINHFFENEDNVLKYLVDNTDWVIEYFLGSEEFNNEIASKLFKVIINNFNSFWNPTGFIQEIINASNNKEEIYSSLFELLSSSGNLFVIEVLSSLSNCGQNINIEEVFSTILDEKKILSFIENYSLNNVANSLNKINDTSLRFKISYSLLSILKNNNIKINYTQLYDLLQIVDDKLNVEEVISYKKYLLDLSDENNTPVYLNKIFKAEESIVLFFKENKNLTSDEIKIFFEQIFNLKNIFNLNINFDIVQKTFYTFKEEDKLKEFFKLFSKTLFSPKLSVINNLEELKKIDEFINNEYFNERFKEEMQKFLSVILSANDNLLSNELIITLISLEDNVDDIIKNNFLLAHVNKSIKKNISSEIKKNMIYIQGVEKYNLTPESSKIINYLKTQKLDYIYDVGALSQLLFSEEEIKNKFYELSSKDKITFLSNTSFDIKNIFNFFEIIPYEDLLELFKKESESFAPIHFQQLVDKVINAQNLDIINVYKYFWDEKIINELNKQQLRKIISNIFYSCKNEKVLFPKFVSSSGHPDLAKIIFQKYSDFNVKFEDDIFIQTMKNYAQETFIEKISKDIDYSEVDSLHYFISMLEYSNLFSVEEIYDLFELNASENTKKTFNSIYNFYEIFYTKILRKKDIEFILDKDKYSDVFIKLKDSGFDNSALFTYKQRRSGYFVNNLLEKHYAKNNNHFSNDNLTLNEISEKNTHPAVKVFRSSEIYCSIDNFKNILSFFSFSDTFLGDKSNFRHINKLNNAIVNYFKMSPTLLKEKKYKVISNLIYDIDFLKEEELDLKKRDEQNLQNIYKLLNSFLDFFKEEQKKGSTDIIIISEEVFPKYFKDILQSHGINLSFDKNVKEINLSYEDKDTKKRSAAKEYLNVFLSNESNNNLMYKNQDIEIIIEQLELDISKVSEIIDFNANPYKKEKKIDYFSNINLEKLDSKLSESDLEYYFDSLNTMYNSILKEILEDSNKKNDKRTLINKLSDISCNREFSDKIIINDSNLNKLIEAIKNKKDESIHKDLISLFLSKSANSFKIKKDLNLETIINIFDKFIHEEESSLNFLQLLEVSENVDLEYIYNVKFSDNIRNIDFLIDINISDILKKYIKESDFFIKIKNAFIYNEKNIIEPLIKLMDKIYIYKTTGRSYFFQKVKILFFLFLDFLDYDIEFKKMLIKEYIENISQNNLSYDFLVDILNSSEDNSENVISFFVSLNNEYYDKKQLKEQNIIFKILYESEVLTKNVVSSLKLFYHQYESLFKEEIVIPTTVYEEEEEGENSKKIMLTSNYTLPTFVDFVDFSFFEDSEFISYLDKDENLYKIFEEVIKSNLFDKYSPKKIEEINNLNIKINELIKSYNYKKKLERQLKKTKSEKKMDKFNSEIESLNLEELQAEIISEKEKISKIFKSWFKDINCKLFIFNSAVLSKFFYNKQIDKNYNLPLQLNLNDFDKELFDNLSSLLLKKQQDFSIEDFKFLYSITNNPKIIFSIMLSQDINNEVLPSLLVSEDIEKTFENFQKLNYKKYLKNKKYIIDYLFEEDNSKNQNSGDNINTNEMEVIDKIIVFSNFEWKDINLFVSFLKKYNLSLDLLHYLDLSLIKKFGIIEYMHYFEKIIKYFNIEDKNDENYLLSYIRLSVDNMEYVKEKLGDFNHSGEILFETAKLKTIKLNNNEMLYDTVHALASASKNSIDALNISESSEHFLNNINYKLKSSDYEEQLINNAYFYCKKLYKDEIDGNPVMFENISPFDTRIYVQGYATNSCLVPNGAASSILEDMSENPLKWSTLLLSKSSNDIPKEVLIRLEKYIEEFNSKLINGEYDKELDLKIKEINRKYFFITGASAIWKKEGIQATFDNMETNIKEFISDNETGRTVRINKSEEYVIEAIKETAKLGVLYSKIKIYWEALSYYYEHNNLDSFNISDKPLFYTIGEGYSDINLSTFNKKIKNKDILLENNSVYTDATKQQQHLVYQDESIDFSDFSNTLQYFYEKIKNSDNIEEFLKSEISNLKSEISNILHINIDIKKQKKSKTLKQN